MPAFQDNGRRFGKLETEGCAMTDKFARVPEDWTDAMYSAAHEALTIAFPHATLDTVVRVINAGIAAIPQDSQQSAIDLDEEQAARLRDYIGAGDRPISLIVANGRCGFGLYAYDTEYPDGPAEFIAEVPK